MKVARIRTQLLVALSQLTVVRRLHLADDLVRNLFFIVIDRRK